MILQRLFSKRTNYDSLDSGSRGFAIWRRKSDKKLRGDIKEIDKRTAGLESAAKNTLGGNLTKKDIREKQAAIREAGNTEKLKRILG